MKDLALRRPLAGRRLSPAGGLETGVRNMGRTTLPPNSTQMEICAEWRRRLHRGRTPTTSTAEEYNAGGPAEPEPGLLFPSASAAASRAGACGSSGPRPGDVLFFFFSLLGKSSAVRFRPKTSASSSRPTAATTRLETILPVPYGRVRRRPALRCNILAVRA